VSASSSFAARRRRHPPAGSREVHQSSSNVKAWRKLRSIRLMLSSAYSSSPSVTVIGRDVRRPLCPCRRGSPRQATVRSSAFRLRRVHPPGRVAWCKTPPVSPSDIGSAIDRPPRAPATATRRRLPVAVCAKPACADGAGSRLSVNPDRQSAAARCHCAAASAGSADSVHADAEDQHLVPPLGDDQFRLH